MCVLLVSKISLFCLCFPYSTFTGFPRNFTSFLITSWYPFDIFCIPVDSSVLSSGVIIGIEVPVSIMILSSFRSVLLLRCNISFFLLLLLILSCDVCCRLFHLMTLPVIVFLLRLIFCFASNAEHLCIGDQFGALQNLHGQIPNVFRFCSELFQSLYRFSFCYRFFFG